MHCHFCFEEEIIEHETERWIPAIALLTAAQVGQALLSVFFALGTRGVIDSAVTGDMNVFAGCSTVSMPP